MHPNAAHDFNGRNVRIVTEEDGAVLFAAVDVARALGYARTHLLIRWLDRDYLKEARLMSPLGGPQKTNLLTEPGLYRAISHSRKPAALPPPPTDLDGIAHRATDATPGMLFAGAASL